MSDWQPIETVPKLTLVDIWVKAKRKSESTRFVNMTLLENGEWFGPREMYTTDKPTHWMYPPKPPKRK